ncbi:DUF58 domain-containing protein [Hahella sp. CR1]|uniref:DUF58 domain-containing protein n=1 Tax=Hahella sp. CR1 TaxID=2992807 RepID=UPI00244223CB|nr:DUF58 domain-containing protein [Hahella sp. CR1]MDG9666240.1 DUF58 domain-containing protein [Hahella sp. CR1]
MKRRGVQPSPQLLYCGLAVTLALLCWQGYELWTGDGDWLPAPGSEVGEGFFNVLMGLATVAVLLLAADLFVSWRLPSAQIHREVRHNLALDQWIPVKLTITHDFPYAATLEVHDHIPVDCEFEGLPLVVPMEPGHRTTVEYRLRPRRRGPLELTRAEVRVRSVAGFWLLRQTHVVETSAKVFPDFASIEGYQLLATDNHTSQMGIRRKPRRGEGMDFHQLREYRQGDSQRQIDWKATSRRQKLISREYQDERDQQVILLLDGGRRMLTQDGVSTHFDHCLNCLLMLSYVALRQGDAVGMMSFGASVKHASPIKGATNINRLINHFYDFYPDKSAPDYLEAARELMQRYRKRSLVVLTTNLREEDSDDIINACRLLQKRHLVLVANLREETLDRTLAEDVRNFDQAVVYAGVVDYLRQRDKLQEKLRAQGLFFVDCAPSKLTAQVINSYFSIKRAGYL